MARTLVIFDIHGAHIPLKQCLEASAFDRENDRLITIGDITDGWPYVYECVEELLTIKTIDIVGNHDVWFRQWLKTGVHPDGWRQGGKGTYASYLNNLVKAAPGYTRVLHPEDVPKTHKRFFEGQLLYYKDPQNRVFVHGGFNRRYTLKEQEGIDSEQFYWDRDLWEEAISVHKGQELAFKEHLSLVFIGHTQTTNWTKNGKLWGYTMPGAPELTAPLKAGIVINGDTGAGSNGRLTIMDVDTLEYWQSEPVNDIYGPYNPRGSQDLDLW